MIDTSNMSLQGQAILMLDILAFENGTFITKTQAKFVGKTIPELMESTKEKDLNGNK